MIGWILYLITFLNEEQTIIVFITIIYRDFSILKNIETKIVFTYLTNINKKILDD